MPNCVQIVQYSQYISILQNSIWPPFAILDLFGLYVSSRYTCCTFTTREWVLCLKSIGETSLESVGLFQLELGAVVALDWDEIVHLLLVSHQPLEHLHRLVEHDLLLLVTVFVHVDLGQSLLAAYVPSHRTTRISVLYSLLKMCIKFTTITNFKTVSCACLWIYNIHVVVVATLLTTLYVESCLAVVRSLLPVARLYRGWENRNFFEKKSIKSSI